MVSVLIADDNRPFRDIVRPVVESYPARVIN